MEHGPEEHLEHAEHAQHAAHNPFDRRVTVSIAIVAAILAGVTMAGHRAHNDTLLLNGKAIQEQTQVGIFQTETANRYAFYEAKKNRLVMFNANVDFISMLTLKEGTEKIQETAIGTWKKEIEKYQTELPLMLKVAKKFEADAADHQKKAEKAVEEGHALHAKADRFDLGELGLQFGVVLCSLAILTKSRNFWYAGLLCSLLGLLVALSGVFGWFMEGAGHH